MSIVVLSGDLIGADNVEMLNTAVVAGSTVTFFCSFDNSLAVKPSWWHCASNSCDKKLLLAVRNRLRSEFEDRLQLNFDTQNERSSLSIVSATTEDAGIYECQRAGSEGKSSFYAVQLIVLGKSTLCLVNHCLLLQRQ